MNCDMMVYTVFPLIEAVGTYFFSQRSDPALIREGHLLEDPALIREGHLLEDPVPIREGHLLEDPVPDIQYFASMV